jgi:hypothetical protein
MSDTDNLREPGNTRDAGDTENIGDAPKAIGLPPREETQEVPTRSDLWGGRMLNAIGLVSPVSNIAMLQFAPRDMRWMGFGAGVICWTAGLYGMSAEMLWLNRGAFGLHYLLVLIGLIDPRWPEVPFRAWIRFGALLGKVVAYPLFSLIYYLAVTPLALCMRIAGKDPLNRKAPPEESYWEDHETRGPERFHRQF